ncbi:monovalent cation/H(+) antiporter subunit G [Winogradskyella psychrotolerans]|uniref:monovalent cation/H(+) antiporter subunit G n=1 Tax=Winogradskyella psychrotolerans TaxID=1344585 RepID=UPI001C07BC2A|nr:monovalent cation/H(+) antiporter subunit G [Winogradskyella psychrotolerans]MBU2927607.1 monovalent cation/H(+) antiporter subunit G [Winogradskyella psychrotolerans]
MSDILVGILATFGTVFVLLAAVGLVRMPDTYLRISVTTKAATLGIGLILIAAAVYFNDLSITSRVLAIILFIVLTAPIAAHLIGRASYFIGIKLWDKSIMDDLKGKYKKRTHELSSEDDDDSSNNEDQPNK